MTLLPSGGVGLAWRRELADHVSAATDIDFIEVMYEAMVDNGESLFTGLQRSKLPVVVHSVSMSLGSADGFQIDLVEKWGHVAERLGASLVSEHISFIRSGGLESGHLVPLPRTRAALDILVDNVRLAQSVLPVPLALENIAALFEWPNAEMDEADFIGALLDRTDALLLLDLSNLYANAFNFGLDPVAFLDSIPLDRIAYVHLAGGEIRDDGLYHDTHSRPVSAEVLDLLVEVCTRRKAPPVLLERDSSFPFQQELENELREIRDVISALDQPSTVNSHGRAGM